MPKGRARPLMGVYSGKVQHPARAPTASSAGWPECLAVSRLPKAIGNERHDCPYAKAEQVSVLYIDLYSALRHINQGEDKGNRPDQYRSDGSSPTHLSTTPLG